VFVHCPERRSNCFTLAGDLDAGEWSLFACGETVSVAAVADLGLTGNQHCGTATWPLQFCSTMSTARFILHFGLVPFPIDRQRMTPQPADRPQTLQLRGIAATLPVPALRHANLPLYSTKLCTLPLSQVEVDPNRSHTRS